MSPTWEGAPTPETGAIGLLGWLRVVLKGVPLAIVVFGGLALLLLIRLVEKPVHGLRRPWTPWITQAVCRWSLFLIGIRHVARGDRMRDPGAVVANHSSWLDIFALNARKRVYFVSKSEVAGWPGIGWLAKATGTVFITRAAREAKAQKELFEARLAVGHKLLFFPEGTSSDGLRVLPFKTTLFAAFFSPVLREFVKIQPVTVIYHAPKGADPQFYGWWGDMDFGAHLVKMLACPNHGSVEVIYHDPVAVADFTDRKALARYCEDVVRRAFPDRLPPATSSRP